ncbi:hypothetical protein N9C44_00480 [bacterium]|jgi:hypothetical protein|nr:hypothetical protein [bacterium]|tara:strand:- start:181 stop:411 length:231 start_codon:yes stop_codon:yes gene_type:complete
MDILKSIGGWAKSLTEVGISVIALGVVLEVLFGGAVPFLGDMQVVSNIMGILNGLSNEGLLGLVGVWILYHIFNKK